MNVILRQAISADVPEIVAMLADDILGSRRENPAEPAPYLAAFERIAADPNQLLLVGERESRVVGTLQLSILHGLSRRGSSRALIEAVRVAAAERGAGLGSELIRQAVAEARRRGCVLVQLTSDAARTDAHRFYERLGFRATHVGFKLAL
ncbi:N-acetyltransferase family protein [Streptomyces sp. URMC 129]|uniref:GNAT family N-acetyltransferase n=1 Tax=Streptomyces sp. URMC 129 TaxID=3423407 RepID=UPI003F1A81CE